MGSTSTSNSNLARCSNPAETLRTKRVSWLLLLRQVQGVQVGTPTTMFTVTVTTIPAWEGREPPRLPFALTRLEHTVIESSSHLCTCPIPSLFMSTTNRSSPRQTINLLRRLPHRRKLRIFPLTSSVTALLESMLHSKAPMEAMTPQPTRLPQQAGSHPAPTRWAAQSRRMKKDLRCLLSRRSHTLPRNLPALLRASKALGQVERRALPPPAGPLTHHRWTSIPTASRKFQ